MTQINLGNIRINWRGAYNSAGNYVRHDAVSYQGSSYIAKRTVSAVTPVQGDDWDLMAAGTDQLSQEGDLLTHNGAIPIRLSRGGASGLPADCQQVAAGLPAGYRRDTAEWKT